MGARERWLLVFLVIVACAIRLVQAGYSFDTDEVFSVRLASRPFTEVVDGALWDRSHPPLHVLLLHFWLQAFGVGEIAARSLSVLFSVVFLFSAYAVARRVAGPLVAAGSLLLIAVSPFFVYYGQQARPYSLIAAMSALNLLLFMRAMDRPAESRGWFAWAASVVGLVYTQYMGVLLLGVEALIALACLRRVAIWPLSLLAAAVLTISPWVWAAMGSHVTEGSNPLDLISWMIVPGPSALGFQLVTPLGEGPLRASGLLLFVLAVLVPGGALLVRRRQFDAQRLLILLGAVGTPILLFAIARLSNSPIFAPRQLIGASFCLLVLLVLCASALPRALGAAALAAALDSHGDRVADDLSFDAQSELAGDRRLLRRRSQRRRRAQRGAVDHRSAVVLSTTRPRVRTDADDGGCQRAEHSAGVSSRSMCDRSDRCRRGTESHLALGQGLDLRASRIRAPALSELS